MGLPFVIQFLTLRKSCKPQGTGIKLTKALILILRSFYENMIGSKHIHLGKF